MENTILTDAEIAEIEARCANRFSSSVFERQEFEMKSSGDISALIASHRALAARVKELEGRRR